MSIISLNNLLGLKKLKKNTTFHLKRERWYQFLNTVGNSPLFEMFLKSAPKKLIEICLSTGICPLLLSMSLRKSKHESNVVLYSIKKTA